MEAVWGSFTKRKTSGLVAAIKFLGEEFLGDHRAPFPRWITPIFALFTKWRNTKGNPSS